MGIVYGLAAALLWGTADFFARLATERVGTRRTVLWMQLSGALCTGAVLAWPAARPHSVSPRTLAFACVIGLLNVAGGTLLYRALEIGTVSLVSPISSTFAAVAAGLSIAAGERPAPIQLAGLGVTAAGVLGASIPPSGGSHPAASRRGLGLAALAALSWGIGFFALRYVVGELGSLFPVFISRVVSTVVMVAVSLVQRADMSPPRGAWHLVIGVAIFDSAAFAAYNLGIAGALTAVVSILSSLFSAVTVLLAFIFLRERLSRMQWVAVGVILAGVAMVSSAG
jgi:drug/metabolite transporter (DMT)-like permease